MNHSTLGHDLMAFFIEARDGDEQTVPRALGGFLGAGEIFHFLPSRFFAFGCVVWSEPLGDEGLNLVVRDFSG